MPVLTGGVFARGSLERPETSAPSPGLAPFLRGRVRQREGRSTDHSSAPYSDGDNHGVTRYPPNFDSLFSRDPSAAQEPKVRRLFAGGRWIRTSGTAAQKPWISVAFWGLRGHRRAPNRYPRDRSALLLLRTTGQKRR